MPVYSFVASDPDGQRVRGVETCFDAHELDQVLERRGLLLVRAREGRARSVRRARRGRILIDFCYHVATALEAGVPITTALHDLQDDGRNPIAEILDDITRKVESGSRLSEAMAPYPQIFPPLVTSLVAAGEETGELPRILRDLVRYLEWTEELRRKISSSLTYPIIVLTGLVGLCVLLTTVVLPNFLQIFVELDVALPLTTRILIAVQGFVSAWWPLLLVGVLAAAASFALVLRNEKGRYRLHALLLRIPVLGTVITMIEMSRLAHNLGLLHASGIPIVRALEMVSRIVQNLVVRDVVSESADSVRHGQTLATAIGARDLMPPMVMRMIALGESSGRLDESLDHVSAYYDREVPGLIDRSLALFNTAVIVTLGVVLASVALGIFVPMYEMMGNLNG